MCSGEMIHHGKGSNVSVAKPPPAEAHRVVKPSWSLSDMLTVCARNVHCSFLHHPKMFTPWKLFPYRACFYQDKPGLSPHLVVFNTPSLFISMWYCCLLVYLCTVPPLPPCLAICNNPSSHLDNKYAELQHPHQRDQTTWPQLFCVHVSIISSFPLCP